VREAELDAAQQDVARLQILAPFDGVVENVHRRKGEWVQPGEPVVKLLRMDRLWIEGMVDASRYLPADLRDKPVVVAAALPGQYERFQGKIVHASDKVEPGPRFRVKAEVVNRQDARGAWVLRSGLTADMTIDLR
jgi:multidrug efflux pump subunit AcrA (membrane-fusion protein)